MYYTRFVCKEDLINLAKSTAEWQPLTGIPTFEKVEKIRCFIYKIDLFPSTFSGIIECSISNIILYGFHFFTNMWIQACKFTVCDRLSISFIDSSGVFFLYRFSKDGFINSFINNINRILNERCNNIIFLLTDCWCDIVIFFILFFNQTVFFIFFFVRFLI